MQTDNYHLKDTDITSMFPYYFNPAGSSQQLPAITMWSLLALVQNTRHASTFLLRSDLPQPDPRHTGRTGTSIWRERPGLVPLHKEEEAGQ